MNTRAQWAEGVQDLYGDGDLGNAGDYLTLAEVSERTSLSPNTLLDALSRPEVTMPTNPMFALSRPAARISNRPLYSHEQVENALQIQRESEHRHLGGGAKPLPVVTAEESRRAELMSALEIARFAGVHEQTVRRWIREIAAFPIAVALRARASDGENGTKVHPGVPIVVREKGAVEAWLRSYIEAHEGKRIERIAEHMRAARGWKIQAGSKAKIVPA